MWAGLINGDANGEQTLLTPGDRRATARGSGELLDGKKRMIPL